jgi:hypothetical protein
MPPMELAQARLLEPARALRFCHPLLLRAAVLDGLSRGERDRAHRCATALPRSSGAPLEHVAVQILASGRGPRS